MALANLRPIPAFRLHVERGCLVAVFLFAAACGEAAPTPASGFSAPADPAPEVYGFFTNADMAVSDAPGAVATGTGNL